MKYKGKIAIGIGLGIVVFIVVESINDYRKYRV